MAAVPTSLTLLLLRHRPDPGLGRLVGAAAREAGAVLGTGFEIIRPGGAFDWRAAHLYRETWEARRLFDAAVASMPAPAPLVVVTDVRLDPPPDWRYLIFRRFERVGGIVSTAPLEPRFWDEDGRGRTSIVRRRLRATLVAALGPLLGLLPCTEPRCWLDRSFDGVDALDAMETLGPAHVPHPSVGKRFLPAPGGRGAERFASPPVRAGSSHPRAFERRPVRNLPLDAGWASGPTATLDLFRFRRLAGGRISFSRRHSTPWAATVRPPLEEVEAQGSVLRQVRTGLARAVGTAEARGINVARPGARAVPALAELQLAGGRLYDLVFPAALERGLLRRGVFLELGIDQGLLDLPFELMHDRDGFLALKHPVGRFVNSTATRPVAHRGPLERADSRSSGLRALVIGAGRARGAPGPDLAHAEDEARAAGQALARLGARVSEIIGPAARVDTVYEALRTGPHVLHYSGHAARGAGARSGRLLLADGDLDAESLARALLPHPPAVAVLNACESGRAPGLDGAPHLGGLIDALLLAGSYVVATSWPVTDRPARSFAERFYQELFAVGNSLGGSVRAAREAARQGVAEDDLTWAAYVLYGDPKLLLRRP